MEINAITLDKAMVQVILNAFSIAEFEGMSSLIPTGKPNHNQLSHEEYAKAEFKVLDALRSIHPEIVDQYFDITKQTEYENSKSKK